MYPQCDFGNKNTAEKSNRKTSAFLASAKENNFKHRSPSLTFVSSNQIDPNKVEWAQISADKIVVATAKQSWLYFPSSTKTSDRPFPHNQDDRFTKPMEGTGSLATTRKLLDGAIAAAKRTVNSNIRPPALTPIRWVWRLAGSYHLFYPTQQLMEEAAIGFAANERWSLAEWALEKAYEEGGHDRLALLDIKSMGYDAKAVVEELIHPAAVALIDYFTRSALDDNPIDSVGYSYTMERLAMGIGEEYIQKIEELLPPRTHATRCLRVHSSVGADIDHAEETVEIVAGLTAKERVRVARACYETALLYYSTTTKDYISDEEIQQILKPLKLSSKLTSCT